MKAVLTILTILSVICSSRGNKNNIQQEGDDVEFHHGQNTERVLYHHGIWSTKKHSSKKSSSKKSSSKKSSSKKSSSKKSSSKEYSSKSSSSKTYGQDGHEVFIQALTCPGQCFTFATSPSLGNRPYLATEECDNCDPRQQWRINTYKGDLVQLENVKLGECVCVADQTSTDPPLDGGVCGDVLKFGPCHKYGEVTDLSIFRYDGGQFYSQYCWEQGFASQVSQSPFPGNEPDQDLCGRDDNNDPFPIVLYPTVLTDPDGRVYPESFFMVTECLLNPNKCNYDWW